MADTVKMSFEPSPRMPWASWYQQLYPPRMTTGFHRWKLATTAVRIVENLWALREHARASYVEGHGSDVTTWPVQHPTTVVSTSLTAHYPPACAAPGSGRPVTQTTRRRGPGGTRRTRSRAESGRADPAVASSGCGPAKD
jgi:hypothetical protein